jgi:signal transduction histidine kinase
MPDGTLAESRDDQIELRAAAADARLVRNVRWRLVAWSGGTTLLILVALAVALYVATARTLEQSALREIADRATLVRNFIGGPSGGPDNAPTSVTFGGGTFAILVRSDGRPIGPRNFDLPEGLPDRASLAAATTGGRDLRTGQIGQVPVRILTVETPGRHGVDFVQVIQDRTAEQRTLDTLLAVLLGGGALVVLVAFGFGAIYANRALVPIRDSLAAQHTALRRQREFAADASHELRTPLTVIRSSIEHLRRHPTEPVARVGAAVEDIDAEVEHLTALVDDLLLLARSDSGAVSLDRLPVDLGDVAADAASSLDKPAASKGVRVVVDPEPAMVVGDAVRLRQLVRILVDNAIRHSPAGGEVVIRVRPNGGSASLEIADQGPGVAPEDMARIFERFWRAPGAPSGGTGLGLAIAKWIVDRRADPPWPGEDGRRAASGPPVGRCDQRDRIDSHRVCRLRDRAAHLDARPVDCRCGNDGAAASLHPGLTVSGHSQRTGSVS